MQHTDGIFYSLCCWLLFIIPLWQLYNTSCSKFLSVLNWLVKMNTRFSFLLVLCRLKISTITATTIIQAGLPIFHILRGRLTPVLSFKGYFHPLKILQHILLGGLEGGRVETSYFYYHIIHEVFPLTCTISAMEHWNLFSGCCIKLNVLSG